MTRVCRDCRWYTYSVCDGGRCSYVLEVPAPWPWTAPERGWPRSGDEDASECESYEEESDGTVD